MEAFHSGKASTLVATDVAARGIHVDDVALVVHADPPSEHKAYLHRSGRTARAGAEGTVITLMTDDQVRDVRDLTRLAGIKPTTTKVTSMSHPILVELAPGARALVPGGYAPPAPAGGRSAGEQGGARSGGGGRNRSRTGGSGRARKSTSAGSSAGSSAGQSGGGQRSGAKATGSGGNGGTGGARRRPAAASGAGGSHSASSFSGRR